MSKKIADHEVWPRCVTVAAALLFLRLEDAAAVELRFTPILAQSFGYQTRVFAIEDRAEPGRPADDFAETSRLDLTLIANLAPTWAARLRYGYGLTQFVDPDNSNTNSQGGELGVGHSFGERFVVDGAVQAASLDVHGFRLNDNDRLAGVLRFRLMPVPGETFEASYAHGERGFPERSSAVTITDPGLVVFGPIAIGGGTTTIPGETQHDREDQGALSLARKLRGDDQAKIAVAYLANDSNFDDGDWKMASAGLEYRAALPRGLSAIGGFQYSRREFGALEIAGKLRTDDVYSAGLTLRWPWRKWLGFKLQYGVLVDRANSSRADFTAHTVGLGLNLNPPEPLVWGR